jgi:hypothetical protein
MSLRNSDMKSNLATGVLTALVYTQVILCFAGVATVLLRDRGEPQHRITVEAEAPATTIRL